jgi:hypothetical protein
MIPPGGVDTISRDASQGREQAGVRERTFAQRKARPSMRQDVKLLSAKSYSRAIVGGRLAAATHLVLWIAAEIWILFTGAPGRQAFRGLARQNFSGNKPPLWFHVEFGKNFAPSKPRDSYVVDVKDVMLNNQSG